MGAFGTNPSGKFETKPSGKNNTNLNLFDVDIKPSQLGLNLQISFRGDDNQIDKLATFISVVLKNEVGLRINQVSFSVYHVSPIGVGGGADKLAEWLLARLEQENIKARIVTD